MKKSVFVRVSIMAILLGLILFWGWGKFDSRKDSENISLLNEQTISHSQLEPLLHKEKEVLPEIYRYYLLLTFQYKDYLAGKLKLEEFQGKIAGIYQSMNPRFEQLEDFRLGFRSRVGKEVLKTKEFNELYHLGYQIRWRLINFSESILNTVPLSKQAIEDSFRKEIKEGFEQELVPLLNLLQFPASQYTIAGDESESNRKNLDALVLKSRLELDFKRSIWHPERIQIAQDNSFQSGYLIVVDFSADNLEQSILQIQSKEVFQYLFITYPDISQATLMWNNLEETVLMIGMDRMGFSYLKDHESQNLDLKKASFLYFFKP